MNAIIKALQNKPAVQVMFGAILISFSGVYVKLSQTGPTASGFYRVFFGGIALLLISMICKKRFWKDRSAFFLGLFAGLFFALDLFTWHKSIHFIGPGLATILANFQVFFLALIGIVIFGEKISLKLIVTIPLAVLGLFMVVGIEWNLLEANYKVGIFLGLTTALCYTGYILTLRKLQSIPNSPAPTANLAVVSFATAAILACLAGFQGESLIIQDFKSFIYLLLYGLFSQVLGWLLIIGGLTSIRASLAGLLLLLQPSLAFVWDILLFEKQVTLVSLVGTIITLAAIYLGATSHTTDNS